MKYEYKGIPYLYFIRILILFWIIAFYKRNARKVYIYIPYFPANDKSTFIVRRAILRSSMNERFFM